MSDFGFPSLKRPLFDFIVAREGVETNSELWSLARKIKILGRLKLFRLVVILYRPKFRRAVSAGDPIHFRRLEVLRKFRSSLNVNFGVVGLL